MTDNLCPCGQPSPHATICTSCHSYLKSDLLAIRDSWDDLVDAMGRVMRFGGNSAKAIGKAQPLPINPYAAEAYRDAKIILTSWANLVLETWPSLEPPQDDGAAIAEWLHDTSDWYIKDVWAYDIACEVRDLLYVKGIKSKPGIITRAIDRPADLQPLGQCGHIHEPERTHDGDTCACACHYGQPGAIPCNIADGCNPDTPTIAAVICPEQLKASRDATDVRCPTCGTTHDVGALRAATLNAHRDIVLPMPQLLDLLGIFTKDERNRKARTIRNWVLRGRVTDRMVEVGTALRAGYRVGEVLDRLTIEERETA